ncbi:helix-turn-helix transcriptional regulator [Salinicoccus siamensis]|uniref:helix-turn-helix transcriptional regulator n=1 Tax=Salinicoccus siamensis TaxID=381830 RepID=UPI0036204D2E
MRKQRGMTQQEVADKSDMTRPHYTMVEISTRDSSISVAMRIARTLRFRWTKFFKKKSNETIG